MKRLARLATLVLLASPALARAQAIAPPAPAAAPPPPAASLALPPPVVVPPLAGWNDGFYIRDEQDRFRFYPRGRLAIDFNSFFGPGVDSLSGAEGGVALSPKIFLRRVQLDFSGEALKRWSFEMQVDFGGQPLANATGGVQLFAGTPGENPTATSAKYAPVQATGPSAAPADVYIDFRAADWLHFMVGQTQAPFSMENRTSNNYHPWMERNLAIRGFVVPDQKETGITAWGEFGPRAFCYEVGVFGGDGQNRPQVDADFDYIGRIFARPLSSAISSDDPLSRFQVGMSARYGTRDQNRVGYQYYAITTGQGFPLWTPSYKNDAGLTEVIIPEGAQRAIGGELRLPFSIFDLRSEAYYVANDMREAQSGSELTSTDRTGGLRGTAWYASLSMWPWGDRFINGDPGLLRPTHLDLSKPAVVKEGLEVMAIAAGINAKYDGASRSGTYDATTPKNAPITIYEMGFGATYWFSRFVKTSVNYIAYFTPGSGDPTVNLAVAPGNTSKTAPIPSAHVLHELGARALILF